MEGGFLLDVVVGEGSAVFQLLSGEDQSLLIRRDTFLVLDLGLDVFNGIRGFDVEGNGLTSQGLDENLHTTSKSEDQMEGGFLLDVVVGEGSAVFNGIRGFDVEGNGLTSQSLNEDLHLEILFCC